MAVVEPAPDSARALLRHLLATGLAGITAGVLVAGIGGRVVMRLAAVIAPEFSQGITTEAGATVGEITFVGTLALVAFVGPFAGLFGAFAYTTFRTWLEWAGRWRGLVFGIVLFALASASSDMLNPDNIDFFILQRNTPIVMMIVGLFLVYGVTVDLLYDVLVARIPVAGDEPRGDTAAHAALIGLGSVATALVVGSAMFTNNNCDCDPPLLPALFTCLAAVATIGWWFGGLRSRVAMIRMPSVVAGFVGLAGTLVFGLTRAISDVRDIIG